MHLEVELRNLEPRKVIGLRFDFPHIDLQVTMMIMSDVSGLHLRTW